MDSSDHLKVRWIRGFSNKNVYFVDKDTIVYPCGSYICFFDLNTKEQTFFQGHRRGVSAFTSNGNNGMFAFSPRGLKPSIFVHSYPDLQLKNELKGSSKFDYISLGISDGPYLVSCSSPPDYTITIWNWENATSLCKHELGGKDIISLVFNPWNCSQICALGDTTLTVWKIESFQDHSHLKPNLVELPHIDGDTTPKSVLNFHKDNEELYDFRPEIPDPATAELTGANAENMAKKPIKKTRVTPAAICWTAPSQLYVSCKEGLLLRVEAEDRSVCVLFNPKTPNDTPELKCGFHVLASYKDNLIAFGEKNIAHSLKIKGTKIEISKTWEFSAPVTTVQCSPDYETIMFATDMGQVFTLTESITKVLDVSCGEFVALALSPTDKSTCMTVRDPGHLQMWSTDGNILGSLTVDAKITSLACCPVANYVALGTASGEVLFIDVRDTLRPRIVHQTHLYHTSVDHLVFDPHGHYLFTSSPDSHIYVLDPKPSERFSVLGYTVLPSPPLTLSAQYRKESEQVAVLALCSEENGKCRILTLLSLPAEGLTEIPKSVNRNGRLAGAALEVTKYRVRHPLTSCVLGKREIFAYCHQRKCLQCFQLPLDRDQAAVEQTLSPTREVKGHQLGPASLALSPHSPWLASLGRDGVLQVRSASSLEKCLELQCHSVCLTGLQLVSFSADSQIILTANTKDGSLTCTNLRMSPAENHQATGFELTNQVGKENAVLGNMLEWSEEVSVRPTEDSQASGGLPFIDPTGQDESFSPHSSRTWLDIRQEAIRKDENKQYAETKNGIKRRLAEIYESLHDLYTENENAPENERIEQREFILDLDKHKRLEASVEEEVLKKKNECELNIAANYYLRDVMKRDCWDSMKVKGRSVKGFHSDVQIKNYPLKERTEQEMENLHRVEQMRQIEMAQRANQEEEGMSDALKSSISFEFGISNPYLYNQFETPSREQKINEITLLQDVIYQLKTAFNTEFDTAHKQKVHELKNIRHRNNLIKEIMSNLGVKEEIWEPSLTVAEWPEHLFTVQDSEITVEKYLTPEQTEELEKKALEEKSRLTAKADDARERALECMMDGRLEELKETVLKLEIPPPEFVLTKPESQWNEEERKMFKEFEMKSKMLNEEKNNYREVMKIELKQLHSTSKEDTERFDESLTKLWHRKIRCEMAVKQEELRVVRLDYSLFVEEEMTNQEAELKYKLELLLTEKDKIGEVVMNCEEEVRQFQTTYETFIDTNKNLDQEFRQMFRNLPRHLLDELYKLFKRRSRVQKVRLHTTKDPIPFKNSLHCGSMALENLEKLLEAVDEMDSPENMPEGLTPIVWKQFCAYRRTQMEKEHQIKMNALTLAEMQAFLQNRREEERAIAEEIKVISEELERLHKVKSRFMADCKVQFVMKQGQVEMPHTDLIPDYTNAVLMPRSKLKDLNKTIAMLGEAKILAMVRLKDIHKLNIRLESEIKRNRLQIEDLDDQARSIETFRASKDQREYLRKTNVDGGKTEVDTLYKIKAFQEKRHLKLVEACKKKIMMLKHQIKLLSDEISKDEVQRYELEEAIAEMTLINHRMATIRSPQEAEENYQRILEVKKLKETARALEEKLTFLEFQVERLRNKNFPSLLQLKHD